MRGYLELVYESVIRASGHGVDGDRACAGGGEGIVSLWLVQPLVSRLQ